VVDIRLGAQVFAQAEGGQLVNQAGNAAVRVVEIAKDACLDRADVDAGGRRGAILAGNQPLRQTAIDAMHAERAFFRHAARPGLDLGSAPFRLIAAVALARLPVERARLVRTGDLTIPAADAQAVIHDHDA